MMTSSRRVFLTSAAATAAGLALSACGQEVPTTQTEDAQTDRPALDSERLTEALTRVQEGLDAADAQKKADLLTGYLTGPAARVRSEQYALATATGDDTNIDHFTTQSQAATAGLTDEFPRDALTVTEVAEGDDANYMLALRQEDARKNYELWGWIRFNKGVVPETNSTAVGSARVGADADGLVATPSQALDSYIEALNDPEGPSGKAFADDYLRQFVASRRNVEKSEAGEVTVTARTRGDSESDGFCGLRTEDNGALVLTTLAIDVVYKRTVARSKLNMKGPIGALMGDNTEVVGSVTATYDVMVAFSILPAGAATGNPDQVATASAAGATDAPSTPITMLGMQQVLASVTRDDSQSPD